LADTSERENAFAFSVRPSCSLADTLTSVSKWVPGKVLHQALIEILFTLGEKKRGQVNGGKKGEKGTGK